MMTRMACAAALLSLTAVPALGRDDPSSFYRTPYASRAAVDGERTPDDGATVGAADAAGFYRSPYAVVLSGSVAARTSADADAAKHDGSNNAATASRACACQHG